MDKICWAAGSADDVVDRFVERAALNGVDVFRIFDAMNDMRNLETAIRAAKRLISMPGVLSPIP